MNNGDGPINPSKVTYYYGKDVEETEQFIGLTKREHFAGLAMQCHIANNPNMSDKALAIASIESADALLKELEK